MSRFDTGEHRIASPDAFEFVAPETRSGRSKDEQQRIRSHARKAVTRQTKARPGSVMKNFTIDSQCATIKLIKSSASCDNIACGPSKTSNREPSSIENLRTSRTQIKSKSQIQHNVNPTLSWDSTTATDGLHKSHGIAAPVQFCGNSDPFSCIALLVSPSFNRVIAFTRDAILPAIYNTDSLRKWSSESTPQLDLLRPPRIISFVAAQSDWLQQQSILYDEGLTLAGFSAWYDLCFQLTGTCPGASTDVLQSALTMRARSSKLLMQRLAKFKTYSSLDKETILHIFWLFRSEALSGSEHAARVHGDALRKVVQSAWQSETISLQNLIQFLFVDVDLSIRLLSRTIFDMDWFVSALQPLWSRANSVMAALPEEVYNVSDDINIGILRDFFVENRRYAYHSTLYPFSSQHCQAGTLGILVNAYAASRTLSDQGRMMNLYVELTETRVSEFAARAEAQRLLQANLILALLFVVRAIGHCAWVTGRDIRDLSPILMAEMYRNVLAMRSHGIDEFELSEAYLWILYIGSLYERRLEMSSTECQYGGESFTGMLRRVATLQSVRSWEEMQAVESRFLQIDILWPDGSQWFEAVLQCHKSYKLSRGPLYENSYGPNVSSANSKP